MVTDDTAARDALYLAHSVLNDVLVGDGGSVFVLFLAELGLPKERIGAHVAFLVDCWRWASRRRRAGGASAPMSYRTVCANS